MRIMIADGKRWTQLRFLGEDKGTGQIQSSAWWCGRNICKTEIRHIYHEVFIGVEWKKYVTDISDGYWEKGMANVPLVAYMLNDKTTHEKVKQHFDYNSD